jgi:glycosyltransferase involved in cell wall biosynthesis
METELARVELAILLPSLEAGGAERVGVNLANAFAARGTRVEMWLVQAQGALLRELDPAVRVVEVPARRLRQLVSPLRARLRATPPRVLLANMWPLTVLAAWAAALARVPTRVVAVEHTTLSASRNGRTPLRRALIRATLRAARPWVHRFLAVSRGAADDLADLAGLRADDVAVAYNPIDVAAPASPAGPLPPIDWWHGAHRRVLAVGTLKPVKDHATLLRALARLRETHDARLLVLGEGECRAALEAQAHALGLGHAVAFAGHVADPRPYYARADAFALSSVAEGFGNVLVEALAAGVPVVSTDCRSGPAEILDHGRYGALVPVGDDAALADALRAVLASPGDPALRRARAGQFSLEAGVDRYAALLFGER